MTYHCKGKAMEGIGMEVCAAQATGFEAADGPDAGPDDGPGLGLPFEAHLNPMELRLARKIVNGLEPADPQEEIHAWHLAVSHILAAQRFGKSRQEGLSQRAEQIEIGLAVRLMTLADRKSAALDRHRAFRLKTAREAVREAREAAQREEVRLARAARERRQAGQWPPVALAGLREPVDAEMAVEPGSPVEVPEAAGPADPVAPAGPAAGGAGMPETPPLNRRERRAALARLRKLARGGSGQGP